MAFKKATLKIGTASYHGWPWDTCLVSKLHWHFFHHIFLLFDRNLELPASIQCDAMNVISPNDLSMWVQACE
jgi:hypothetical protein